MPLSDTLIERLQHLKTQHHQDVAAGLFGGGGAAPSTSQPAPRQQQQAGASRRQVTGGKRTLTGGSGARQLPQRGPGQCRRRAGGCQAIALLCAADGRLAAGAACVGGACQLHGAWLGGSQACALRCGVICT